MLELHVGRGRVTHITSVVVIGRRCRDPMLGAGATVFKSGGVARATKSNDLCRPRAWLFAPIWPASGAAVRPAAPRLSDQLRWPTAEVVPLSVDHGSVSSCATWKYPRTRDNTNT